MNVGNLPVKQVYVGSTQVKSVYVGAEKIWPSDPRVVTINSDFMGYWQKTAVTGDTDLIQAWVGSDIVRFEAPITCNQRLAPGSGYTLINPGTVIQAGTEVKPYPGNSSSSYTFTEVL